MGDEKREEMMKDILAKLRAKRESGQETDSYSSSDDIKDDIKSQDMDSSNESYLYRLYANWIEEIGSQRKISSDEFNKNVLMSEVSGMKDYSKFFILLKGFANLLERHAESIFASVDTDMAVARDADIQVQLSSDCMDAFMVVFPPIGDGQDIDLEKLISLLKSNGINFGLNDELMSRIVKNEEYFKIFNIAKGIKPQDGIDGYIKAVIDIPETFSLQEDENGNVDFKNLNLFRNIYKGDVICEITQPVEGKDGTDVSGAQVVARKGIMPDIPMGKNTELSEDNAKLISLANGYIKMRDNRYCVEEKLTIGRDVDSSVGNLDFPGDLVIKGSVMEGFTIKASGNIRVEGVAQNCDVVAGKSVVIINGMNGGSIRAGTDVRCKFLENCNVYSDGNIYASSIIGCNVFCNASVNVTDGKGIIVGGRIAAAEYVEAKTIGSRSNLQTDIDLGFISNDGKSREQLEEQLNNINVELAKIDKNVTYINKLGGLSKKKEEIYNTILEQKRLYSEMKMNIVRELEELDSKNIDFSGCYVKASKMFRPTRVTIGNAAYTVDRESSMCVIRYGDGEVYLAMG